MTIQECKAAYILLVPCICHFNILQRRVSCRVFLLYLEHLVPLPIRILYILNIFHYVGSPLRQCTLILTSRGTHLLRMHIYFFYIECIELHIIISDIALYIEMGYPFIPKLCDLLIQAHE